MRTSILKLLEQKNREKAWTVYGAYQDQINEFIITAGNFFELEPVEKWDGNTWIQCQYQELMNRKKEHFVYRTLKAQRDMLQKEIIRIKETDHTGYGHIEELRVLRRARKGLDEALEDLVSCYQEEVMQELLRSQGVKRLELLAYKNTVCVGSFTDLERQIPLLSGLKLPWVRQMPLLLANIKSVCKAVEEGQAIGLVGGPCLFGTYEVEIQVRHKDGSVYSYDFSSGRHYDGRKNGGMDFADHIERYCKDIADIDFHNWKKGVTTQEYDSLEVVFAFGAVLGAKVAIPIPDISYLKYLSTVITPMKQEFRMTVLERFRVHTRKIADMYLKLIGSMQNKYPEVEVQVLHERNEELCSIFHEEREKYFRKSGLIHRMTARRQKTDAIFDYISMLALPYYIWGTPQVIQIDNLDETDSYRKCRKVHKDAFSLSAVLYPERLSADGKETIFNAALEYKEYLDGQRRPLLPESLSIVP